MQRTEPGTCDSVMCDENKKWMNSVDAQMGLRLAATVTLLPANTGGDSWAGYCQPESCSPTAASHRHPVNDTRDVMRISDVVDNPSRLIGRPLSSFSGDKNGFSKLPFFAYRYLRSDGTLLGGGHGARQL